MPGTVNRKGQTHRRLAEKTLRSDILTRFGGISLLRGRYRRGRSGPTIFPLEMLLGIEDGGRPAATERIGKQFADAGSSQGRTLAMIYDQIGTPIGTEKLRRIATTLAEEMKLFREDAEVEKLIDLVEEARVGRQTPVLSVSRDGVALGLAPGTSSRWRAVISSFRLSHYGGHFSQLPPALRHAFHAFGTRNSCAGKTLVFAWYGCRAATAAN